MRECPQCYSSIFDPRAGICPVCGSKVSSIISIVRGAETSQEEVLLRFLDEEMVDFRRQFEEKGVFLTEKILRKSREVLENLPREIPRATVLFISLNAESQTQPKRQELWDLCIERIMQKGGIIAEFGEQGLLCIFGAPVSFDYDVESAVRAACDIQELLEQIPDKQNAFNFRIGIATGNFGIQIKNGAGEKRFHFEGGAITEAGNILSAASKNEILICPATHSIIKSVFTTSAGSSIPGTTYRILKKKPTIEQPLEKETPFCGRKKEWKALQEFFRIPSSRGGRILHLTGEEGIGKTRLIKEYLKKNSLEERSFWWEGDSLYQPILLYPVIRWLREILNIGISSGVNQVQKSIRKFMRERSWVNGHDCLVLEYLFGVSEAMEAFRGLPPERIQRNIFGTLHQLILSLYKKDDQLIIIIDNAQWLDSLTRKYLQSLLNTPYASRISIVYIHPDPEDRAVEMAPDHVLLDLRQFGKKDREHLLKGILPLEDFLPEIRKIALSRSNGNPLFLEEISRLIHQFIRDNPDLYTETGANRIIEIIPTSLTELIRNRMDRLDAQSRLALQCASLLGMNFCFSLLEVFDTIREGLTDHLQALSAMNYLRRQPEPDTIHYYFTHALFRDVSYSTLLEEQKKRLHANLAHHLEKVFRNRLQEYYELLAYHFSKGEETNKAIYYLVKAGDRQSGMGGGSNALENYIEALELLKTLAVTDQRLTLMGRVLIRAARLQRSLGSFPEAAEMLSGALNCAKKVGNERLILEARLEQAITLVWDGHGVEAEKILRDIIPKAAKLNCSLTKMAALNSLGVLHWQKGALEEALQAFQELALAAEEYGTFHIQADAFNNAGLVYWKWGQYPEALKAFKRSLPLRKKVGDNFGLCATLMNIGIIQEQMGQVVAARKSYQGALDKALKTGYIQGVAALESNLSNLERRVGTMTSALEHAMRSIDYSERAEDPYLASIAWENAGMALSAREETEKARSHFMKALEIAKTHQNREREISARLSLLELALKSEKIEKSIIREINQLIDLVEKHNYSELIPRLYRLKGQAMERVNPENPDSAGEYLELAHELARNSGNLFEEIESVQILVSWARKRHKEDLIKKWETFLNKLKTIMT